MHLLFRRSIFYLENAAWCRRTRTSQGKAGKRHWSVRGAALVVLGSHVSAEPFRAATRYNTSKPTACSFCRLPLAADEPCRCLHLMSAEHAQSGSLASSGVAPSESFVNHSCSTGGATVYGYNHLTSTHRMTRSSDMQLFQAAKCVCHPSQGSVTNPRAFHLLGR
jgi:hypothetical protein